MINIYLININVQYIYAHICIIYIYRCIYIHTNRPCDKKMKVINQGLT